VVAAAGAMAMMSLGAPCAGNQVVVRRVVVRRGVVVLVGGGGFQQPTDAAGVMAQFGLNAPELKVTDAQKASIEKLANAYLEEQKKTAGGDAGRSAEARRREPLARPLRTKFTDEVGKVLTPDQKKTFDAAQAARRGPGGGGPGGGWRSWWSSGRSSSGRRLITG